MVATDVMAKSPHDLYVSVSLMNCSIALSFEVAVGRYLHNLLCAQTKDHTPNANCVGVVAAG